MLAEPPTLPTTGHRQQLAGLLVLFMLVAAGISWWATRHGTGYGADADKYLFAARSLAQQGELLSLNEHFGTEPFTHWPPLYPLALAATAQLTAGDVPAAARWLNILLYPLNTALMFGLAWRFSRSVRVTAAVATLFLLLPVVMDAHGHAASESLYITFWLITVGLLAAWPEPGPWLGRLAALAAGMALLTRYGSASLVAAGAIFVLVVTRGGWWRRLLEAVIFFAVAVAPLAWWLHVHPAPAPVFNPITDLSGTSLERKLGFYPLSATQWQEAANSLLHWIQPLDRWKTLQVAYAVLIAVGAAAVAYGLAKSPAARPKMNAAAWRSPAVLLWLNLILNSLMLLLAGMFFDPVQTYTDRVHLASFMSLLLLGAHAWRSWVEPFLAAASRWVRAGFAGLAGLTLASYMGNAAVWLHSVDARLGYWRNSEAITILRREYADRPIFTDQVSTAYLYTGNVAVALCPKSFNRYRNAPNPNFDASFRAMIAEMKKFHAVFFYIPSVSGYEDIAKLSANYPDLKILHQTPEATIFGLATDIASGEATPPAR